MIDKNNSLENAIDLHIRNKFQEAFDQYIQIINQDKDNYQAFHYLGILLIQVGYKDIGTEYIQKAMALNNEYKLAYENLQIFNNPILGKYKKESEHSIQQESRYQKIDIKNVGNWRFLRMLDFVKVLKAENSNWLTVGDAFGYDSILLKYLNIKNVVASNLETSALEVAFKENDVEEYMKINAEKIQLEDNSFDYILCKEALHHMPRPYIAIYEMLRVAKKGVIFIDPQDQIIDWPVKKNELCYRELINDPLLDKKVSYKNINSGEEIINAAVDWWEDGPFNYVYTLSKREVRKISLGLGIPSYATKTLNDFFKQEWAEQQANKNSEGYLKTVEQIQLHDKICELTGKPSSYITGIFFKETPSMDVVEQLKSLGYDFTYTPTRFIPIKWKESV